MGFQFGKNDGSINFYFGSSLSIVTGFDDLHCVRRRRVAPSSFIAIFHSASAVHGDTVNNCSDVN